MFFPSNLMSTAIPVLSVSFSFIENIDPILFHCVRYIGPPFKAYKKSNKFFIFEFPNQIKIIAPLLCTWCDAATEGKLILPLWMQSYYSLLFLKSDLSSNITPMFMNVFDCPNPPTECVSSIKIRWFESPLKATIEETKTFPFDQILPELFSERRPLKNGSVLPFVYMSRRFLLQIERTDTSQTPPHVTSNSDPGSDVFYFNFEEGDVDLESLFDATEIKEKENDVIYANCLKVLIKSSWKKEMNILNFELSNLTKGLNLNFGDDIGKEVKYKLILITGIPYLLQMNLLKLFKIDSEAVDLASFISEEHFETSSLSFEADSNSDFSNDRVKTCHLFGCESLSESFLNKIFPEMVAKLKGQGRNFHFIFFSDARSLEASKNLMFLEKLAKRHEFEVLSHSFPSITEQDRLEIIKMALANGKKANENEVDFEGIKWILSSLDFTDIMRLSKLTLNMKVGGVQEAAAILKEEQNNYSTSASASGELKDFASILSFRGSEPCVPFYGFKEIKTKICSLLTGPFLNSEAYKRFSLPTSAGILLHGPTGSGKTALSLHLLSSPLINNIFSIIHVPSGSQLLSKYFGETEANIRALFAKARAMKPSILFIDQIECLGRKRGDHEDSEIASRSLSTLLNEMDGISGNDGVTILACTDDISQLDEALLRPGRLDYHFGLDPTPNASNRLEIISGYLDLKFGDHSEIIDQLVNDTEGLSGREIKTKINLFKRESE